jgi:hypothetical protein
MEAFLRGKKRKSIATSESTQDDDNESTDVKLAILASLFPNFGQDALLEALLAHEGSVEAASSSLAESPTENVKKRPAGVIGHQTSLFSFASGSSSSGRSSSPKKTRLLSKKGTTLHLYDPEDVSVNTPCTIVHNFLPQDIANDLLKEMLDESKTFEKTTFKIFDNIVASPHTSTFYVETEEELTTQKYDYYYNGSKVTVSIPDFSIDKMYISRFFKVLVLLCELTRSMISARLLPSCSG